MTEPLPPLHITIKDQYIGDLITVDVAVDTGGGEQMVCSRLVPVSRLRRWLRKYEPCFVYRQDRVYRRGINKNQEKAND